MFKLKQLKFLLLLFLPLLGTAQTSIMVTPGGDTVKTIYFKKVVISNPDTTPIPPTPPPITSTLRYTLARHLYIPALDNFTVGQNVTSIPDLKGTATMGFSSNSAPLLGYPTYGKEGLVYLENTASNGFKAYLGATPVTREVWFVMMKSNYFEYEGWFNQFDVNYLGELGGIGLRVQSGSTSPTNSWQYPTYVVPQNQIMIIRYQVLNVPNPTSGNPLVALSINNTLLGSGQFTVPIKSNTIGWGTDGPNGANCAMMGVYMYGEYPPLTSAQASALYAELAAKYSTASINPTVPIATNLTFSRSGGNTTINYTYSGTYPENVAGRIIKWVSSTNPTVSTFLTQFNNLQTISSTFSNGRVEVTVEDTHGNYSTIPQSITTD